MITHMLNLRQLYEVGTLIIPTLQIRKLRHKELAQGNGVGNHRAGIQTGLRVPELMCLPAP